MYLAFGKFRILCINLFVILLKAATLNPYKLQDQLHEVDYILQNKCQLCHTFLDILISIYLEIKFFMGYITLAANTIAIFPILTEDLPHLLLPALIAQSIDYIALNFIEIMLGFLTTRIVAPQNISVFAILLTSKLFQIVFAIASLNLYTDFYQQLNFFPLKSNDNLLITNEKLLRKQSLE